MTEATQEAQEDTNVAALSDDTRREIVELREGGMTLAELRKRFPQLTSEQLRAVLPPLLEPEPQAPRTRKPRAAKTTQTPAKPAATRTSRAPTKGSQAAPAKPKANGQPSKQELALAKKVVTMRGKLVNDRPPSWAKIAFALKVVDDGASKQQAGSTARRLYKLVKGENAPTGPSDY
jgi:hypothetical protein